MTTAIHDNDARDHIADVRGNAADMHRFRQLYDFPDFVKQANMEETLQPARLTTAVYADPTKMLYPCHNAASTWLSALYFSEKKGSYHPKIAAKVQQRLDGFVKAWGIKEAVDKLLSRAGELHKNADDALPDSDFAYVWVGDDHVKQRHLRIKSAMEVKAAADWLYEYRDKLPYAHRNVIACKIHEKAARYGAALGAAKEIFVEKQAGLGMCEPQAVVQMIMVRSKLASDAGQREQIEKLAQSVAKAPRFALQPDMLIKLATTIDDVDRKLGLVGKYGDTIQRPEDVIFSVTYKEAQAGIGGACQLTTGNVYDKTAFTKISLDDVESLFGSDVAKEVSAGLKVDSEKLAEFATTMPRPDAELFEKLLNEAGVPPIHTKRASDGGGRLNRDALGAMAGHY